MKKFAIILVLILAACGLMLFSSRYGVKIGSLSFALDKDKQTLEQRSKAFWEDVQYKDFKSAAKYHEKSKQKKHDIPYLLERLFLVKPEQLDIRSIEVEEVSIDSTRKRGRSRTKLTLKILNANKLKTPKVILYWYKKNQKWYMRLESSLHALKRRK